MEAIDKRNKERRKVEAEKRKNEQEFLRYQEKHLSTFLKNLEQKSWTNTKFMLFLNNKKLSQ